MEHDTVQYGLVITTLLIPFSHDTTVIIPVDDSTGCERFSRTILLTNTLYSTLPTKRKM